MRLVEFYALQEGRAGQFTIEPEVNGHGRLLAWEARPGVFEDEELAGDEQSYEVVAVGDLDRLVGALFRLMPQAQQFEDDIRQTYEQCVSEGDAVLVDAHGVDVTARATGRDFQKEALDFDEVE